MRDSNNKSILFLGKEDDQHCLKAIDFLKLNFDDIDIFLGKWGDPIPKEIFEWRGDYIISYLCRWVLPLEIINRAAVAAINFHPASPDYPGFGCNNFALYNEEKIFGITCHHIAEGIDSGEIISTKEFPIFFNDDVASLLLRTYDFQLILFYETLTKIVQGDELTVSEKKWTRKPYTRKDFEELLKIDPEMGEEEVARRVRATKYDGWKGNRR